MNDISPPRQTDIAKLTGLSQATISRALRGDPAVVANTRALVMKACDELGYRPSIGGRLLSEGRRAVVGLSLSIPGLSTQPHISLLHQALSRHLFVAGWSVSLLTSEDFEAGLPNVGVTILAGVMPGDPRLEACKKINMPVVAIGHTGDQDVFAVGPDDTSGVDQVIRHFTALGRQSLAVMSPRALCSNAALNLRSDLARKLGEAAGMEIVNIPLECQATSTLSGYRGALANRSALSHADCLFCSTGEHALGVVAACEDDGRAIGPEKDALSLVGFDDVPDLSLTLSTVTQDFDAIATAALTLRHEALMKTPPRKIVLPVTLVVRKT